MKNLKPNAEPPNPIQGVIIVTALLIGFALLGLGGCMFAKPGSFREASNLIMIGMLIIGVGLIAGLNYALTKRDDK